MQKERFLYMNVNNNDSHQQNTMCTFLSLQKEKHSETFIYKYKNPDTLLKARQFALRFYWQKGIHFTLHNFSWILKLAFIYTQKAWHFALRNFIYTKSQTLRNKTRQFALRFLNTKSLTLCVTQFFMEFLILAEGMVVCVWQNCRLST